MEDSKPTEEERLHLIEVYKTMWNRVNNIDRIDLSYIAIPPTVVGLIITWFTLMPAVDQSKMILGELFNKLVGIMSIGGQILVGVTALVLLRSYVDHARAISNISAVEKALGISKYIPRRLSLRNSNTSGKFLARILRSNKGILFIFYNILLWGIAFIFKDCKNYVAAALLQVITFIYLFYYVRVFPSEKDINKE